MDIAAASIIYRKHCDEHGVQCREPLCGAMDRGTYWFFADQERVMGRFGAIVRKSDGMLTVVAGVGCNHEIIFWAYEQGILAGKCDLVITSFSCHVDDVIDVLTKTPPSQRGLRLPGPGREKWREALATTPVKIFSGVDLCSYVFELWEVQLDGTFSFEIHPLG